MFEVTNLVARNYVQTSKILQYIELFKPFDKKIPEQIKDMKLERIYINRNKDLSRSRDLDSIVDVAFIHFE